MYYVCQYTLESCRIIPLMLEIAKLIFDSRYYNVIS